MHCCLKFLQWDFSTYCNYNPFPRSGEVSGLWHRGHSAGTGEGGAKQPVSYQWKGDIFGDDWLVQAVIGPMTPLVKQRVYYLLRCWPHCLFVKWKSRVAFCSMVRQLLVCSISAVMEVSGWERVRAAAARKHLDPNNQNMVSPSGLNFTGISLFYYYIWKDNVYLVCQYEIV